MRGSGFLVAGLLCAFAVVAHADDADAARALAAGAKTKLDAGDAKGAEADLTKAVETAPKEASIRRQRAEARAKLGDVKGTVEDLRKAAELDPKQFPLDLAVWRRAVEAARSAGGSKDPDLALIQAEVEEIRGKKFKAPVASAFQKPEDFGKVVAAMLDKEMPVERRDDIQAGLRRLGLLDPAVDLNKEVTDALMSQAAAYYDPEKDKFFYLASDLPAQMLEATAAHELVHALQDQHHDLGRWLNAAVPKPGETRNDDVVLAMRCVAEGEATLVHLTWQIPRTFPVTAEQAQSAIALTLPQLANLELEQFVQMTKQMLAGAPPDSTLAKAAAQMETIQPYVLVPLMAAYLSGAGFVHHVRTAGGWDAVDKLYAAPPASAEQCLYPSKYAKKPDLPTRLALPELPEVAAAGWHTADAAIHGELYLRVLLRRAGAASADARKAAAGWDGDVYRAWRAKDGRTAIVLATTWDAEKEAGEFFASYRAGLAKKYPKLAPETADDPMLFLYGCGEEALGTGALVQRGREVFAVEGFPAELRAKVLVKLADWKVEHVE